MLLPNILYKTVILEWLSVCKREWIVRTGICFKVMLSSKNLYNFITAKLTVDLYIQDQSHDPVKSGILVLFCFKEYAVLKIMHTASPSLGDNKQKEFRRGMHASLKCPPSLLNIPNNGCLLYRSTYKNVYYISKEKQSQLTVSASPVNSKQLDKLSSMHYFLADYVKSLP